MGPDERRNGGDIQPFHRKSTALIVVWQILQRQVVSYRHIGSREDAQVLPNLLLHDFRISVNIGLEHRSKLPTFPLGLFTSQELLALRRVLAQHVL